LGFKAIVDMHDEETGFNQAWDSIGGQRFRYLRRFCAGLATVFANMTAVESVFSILKWEKDEFPTALLDLSLEGIFQSKHFEQLGFI
jgi:hypothetical protein